MTTDALHLKNAAKLSNKPGPHLFQHDHQHAPSTGPAQEVNQVERLGLSSYAS